METVSRIRDAAAALSSQQMMLCLIVQIGRAHV